MNRPRRLGFGDIVLCPATLGSPSLEDHARAAAGGGFDGITLRPHQIIDACARLGSMDAVRRVLDDSGLVVADIDSLKDWVDDPHFVMAPHVPADLLLPRRQVFELALGVGASALNVVDLSDSERDWQVMIDSYARVCDEAAEYGITTYIEFFFGCMMHDVTSTARVVDGAGRDNGGILLDTFHYARGPANGPAQLALHATRVRMLHLSDAGADRWSDQWEERQHGRLLPGTGTTDLVGTLRMVRDAGGNPPVGVEVNNDALRAMPPVEAATLAARATRSVLELVDSVAPG